MLVHFSIWPMDNPHMSRDMTRVYEKLDQLDIPYEISVMGTTISGDWDEVMPAIKACHEMMVESHDRVLINITMDHDNTRSQSLESAQDRLEQSLPS